MKDYMKRFMIALIMALCVSLLMIGGGLAQSKGEKKQSHIENGYPDRLTGTLHIGEVLI